MTKCEKNVKFIHFLSCHCRFSLYGKIQGDYFIIGSFSLTNSLFVKLNEPDHQQIKFYTEFVGE